MLDRLRIFRRLKDMEQMYAREIPQHLGGYIAAHDARIGAIEDELEAKRQERIKATKARRHKKSRRQLRA